MNKADSPVVVCDAGPVIHLDELKSLALLGDFSTVFMPAMVWVEVLRHRPKLPQAGYFPFEIVRPKHVLSGELAAMAKSLRAYP
jgi:hypothetical protein